MASKGFLLTLGTQLTGAPGHYPFTAAGNDGGTSAITALASLTTDLATLSTAIGVLVADGASPTQAHVTTANTALTAVNADLVTVNAGIITGDMQVSYDTARITNINHFKRACDTLLRAARGAGIAEG